MNEYLRKALHHAEIAETIRTTTGDYTQNAEKLVEYNLNLAMVYALIGHSEATS